MTLLVFGGSGFIGSNFIFQYLSHPRARLVNVDKLTYAGQGDNLSSLQRRPGYSFWEGDITDREIVARVFDEVCPSAVINFAAESHVDRSIQTARPFVETNVIGTLTLLEQSLIYWHGLSSKQQKGFRFVNVSTDEVFGSLQADELAFSESSRYSPNSPYSASKAAADHLARSFFVTHGLPVVTTNCSNNYGPYQFPEKLIPLCILNAMKEKPIPIYGDGLQVRDWIHVNDHVSALILLLTNGRPGETYNIGASCELANLEVVKCLCDLLNQKIPRPEGMAYHDLITHIEDRKGHDARYAVNARKITEEFDWSPKVDFFEGLDQTVDWYLANTQWLNALLRKSGQPEF